MAKPMETYLESWEVSKLDLLSYEQWSVGLNFRLMSDVGRLA